MSPRIVIAKLLGSLATLAFVVVFNFFLFRVVEEDPVASLFRGRNLSDSQRDELTREFGLDGSKLEQFWSYVQQTLGLNFGRSYITNQPVIEEIADKAPATIALVGVSALLSAVFGILIGDHGGVAARLQARLRRDDADDDDVLDAGLLARDAAAVVLRGHARLAARSAASSDPNGPDAGIGKLLDQAEHLLLPAITLTVAYLGEYALVMRSSLIDTMREDYLVLARAKGLRDVLVRNRHAVPNALLPVVTLIAINFGFVLSGAIAVETIFSWPGLGLATYEALQGPDLPMLQGLFLVFSAAVIFFNLLADLLYAALDPRVRAA